MNEKTLIVSSPYNLDKPKKLMILFGKLTVACLLAWCIIEAIPYDFFEQRQFQYFLWDVQVASFCFACLFALISLVLAFGYFFFLKPTKLIVTDKRVYGKAVFGRQVDLPIDKISAVGMSFFKGISIGTSAGRIGFPFIKNRDEMHKSINDLLIMRQEHNFEQSHTSSQPKYEVDSLRKYKELLDEGIITQEEFDAKKKQLLGL